MKKKLVTTLMALVLTLSLAMPAFAYTEYGLLYDATDLLDADFASTMGENTMYAFTERNAVEIRVDVVDDLEDETIEDYARIFYDQYEYGYSGTDNGYLLMLFLTEDDTGLAYHDSCVICGGDDQEFLSGSLPSLETALDQWLNEAAWSGDLNQDNVSFQAAIQLYVALTDEYLSGGTGGEPAAETEPGAPIGEESNLSTPCVQDTAGLLAAQEWEELEQKAREISQQYQCGVYITTVDDYQDYAGTIRDCAKGLYQQLALGYGSGKDGIMLTLSMADRDYWLLACGDFGNTALTDYGRDAMSEEFLDHFAENDWYGGFSDYLEACAVYLQAAQDGNPVDVGSDSKPLTMGQKVLGAYGIALAVGLVIAFLVCRSFKAKMRTAVEAAEAEEYVPAGGVDIHVRQDHFLHTTTSRRKISKDSDSGGTTVDSDGFSGSGGKF